MTAADIIDAIGGAAAVSRALQLPFTTVFNWHSRQSIPARYHHRLIVVSGGKITAEQIALAHAVDWKPTNTVPQEVA